MPSLDLADGAVEYRVVDGDPALAPLVFLHEGLGCAAMWARFPDLVARETGRAAVVYTRHGYGGSAPLRAPRTADYLHHEAERVLPELLDRLAVRDPVLVGHSDGASIALLHAAARATTAVVAIAPHVFVEPETLAGIAEADARFRGGELARLLARFHDDPEAVFRSWADLWLSPGFRTWNIEDRLPRVGCPVLLVQGTGDAYGTRRQLDKIISGVPGRVEVLEVPGCGHSPHLEQPGPALAAVAGFAGSLTAR